MMATTSVTMAAQRCSSATAATNSKVTGNGDCTNGTARPQPWRHGEAERGSVAMF